MNAPRPGCGCAECVRAASLLLLRERYLSGRGPLNRLAVEIGVPLSEARRLAVEERWADLKRAREEEIRQHACGRTATEAAVVEVMRRTRLDRRGALRVVILVASSLELEGVDRDALEVV
jgi:hypothetical protein